MRVGVQGDAERRATIVAALRASGIEVVEGGGHDTLLTIERVADPGVPLHPVMGVSDNGARAERLTRIESALLLALSQAGAGGLDRGDLHRTVWGLAFDPGTNLVAVHVCRLRRRIGRGAILFREGRYRIGNVAGVGAL